MADLQTFQAPSMPEALTQVKRALGHDALILHTRNVARRTWLGLRKQNIVEVTAKSNDAPRSRREPTSRESAHRDGHRDSARSAPGARLNSPAAAYARNSNAAVAASLSAAVAKSGPAPRTATLLETSAGSQLMMKVVADEVTGLRTQLRELLGEVRRTVPSPLGPKIEGELAGQYQLLLDSQLLPVLAEDIIKAVRLGVPATYHGNKAFIDGKIAEQIEKLVPVSGPIRKSKTGSPHIVALIGPTGVGKTTTLAKLAADLQLRNRQRVGLITLDTYRIAAVDQLRRYADIIGAPLKVVSSPHDLPAAIESLGNVDYILIDTAGRSPNDSMKLSELRSYLDAAKPDEVHLVLSTVCDPKSIDLAVRAFSKVRVDKLLFTKMDEAAHVGVIVNVARSTGKPLSYLTTGQDVPDDIEIASARNLAARILSHESNMALAGGIQ
jgi:flagellar biosynthesis protein FlhF